MRNTTKLGILIIVTAILIAVFLFTDVKGSWDYVLTKERKKYSR